MMKIWIHKKYIFLKNKISTYIFSHRPFKIQIYYVTQYHLLKNPRCSESGLTGHRYRRVKSSANGVWRFKSPPEIFFLGELPKTFFPRAFQDAKSRFAKTLQLHFQPQNTCHNIYFKMQMPERLSNIEKKI